MKTLTKLSLWTALPLLLLGIPVRSVADVTLQTETIVSTLQQRTQVPIFVPTLVPQQDEIYVSVGASAEGYSLSFNVTPECKGETACRFGSLEANRGEEFYTEPSSESVTLANGVRGLYTLVRGPYYTALVQWEYQGVLYKAGIKNGQKKDVIALANSAITAGPKPPASHPVNSNLPMDDQPPARQRPAVRLAPGTRAVLTSLESGTPINVRDGASTKAYARHIGYAGDSVKILDQKVSNDGATWYRVRFEASGATGWVRGDFVALDFHNSH